MYVLALLTVVCVIMTWILPTSINFSKGSLYTSVNERMEKRRLEKEAQSRVVEVERSSLSSEHENSVKEPLLKS